MNEIFCIPINDKYLVYAPLNKYYALVDINAIKKIKEGIEDISQINNRNLRDLIFNLFEEKYKADQIRSGPIKLPLFLGLVTTRRCNLGCRYCDFSAPKQTGSIMSFPLTKEAIDLYFSIIKQSTLKHAQIQFFGGEPLCGSKVIDFAYEYGHFQANSLGFDVHFDITTNGMFSTSRCYWLAENFDTVVLSFDGIERFQNFNRPNIGGKQTFDHVFANAKILSDGNANLQIRCCVTNEMVKSLPEIAKWISDNLKPELVCFEALVPSGLSAFNKMSPPDPLDFAIYYDQASEILNSYQIETVTSSADIEKNQISFCPVGKDAIIITPEGRINACYQLEKDWIEKGLDLNFGMIHLNDKTSEPHHTINMSALEKIRKLSVLEKASCQSCFCKYHCAGGCHITQSNLSHDKLLSNFCIQTRLLTASKLLRRLGLNDIYENWIRNPNNTLLSTAKVNDYLIV